MVFEAIVGASRVTILGGFGIITIAYFGKIVTIV